jgi:hypothetical protein
MMPTYLGNPFYPHGMPVSYRDININGQPLTEYFSAYSNDTATPEQTEILKAYVTYYLGGPLWQFSEPLPDLSDKSVDELIEICFEHALDPF